MLQNSTINVHADASSGTRDLHFGLSLHLHPLFVHASSEGSCQSAHLHSKIFLWSGHEIRSKDLIEKLHNQIWCLATVSGARKFPSSEHTQCL